MVADRTTEKSLEDWIWVAACRIRVAEEAPKYKHFFLPLGLTKWISELATEAEVTEVEEEDVKQRPEASNPSVAIHVRNLDPRSSQ